ncbi:hypothetical protein SNE40_009540 [Patella caerulea]|uniref:SOCS box domain-containing protein n=1 Tax=Patella caerulea TaxID=87958 RepID=A0AAN8JTP6_PATCE
MYSILQESFEMETIPSAPPVPKISRLNPNKYDKQPSKKGRRFLKELQFKLVGAIESHNVLEVNRLIKSGVDLDCIILIHKTPLIHAIEKFPSDPTLAVTLMEAGANVEKPEVVARRRFPIHFAVMSGSLMLCIVFNEVSSVKYLLNRGADVNLQDVNGNTPLHIACNPLARDHIRVILTTSVDYYKRTRRIPTPELQTLFLSEQGGCLKTVQFLVNAGADVNKNNKIDVRPIHNTHSADIMVYLIACGSEIGINTLINLELSGETNLVKSVRNSNSFSGQMTLLHKSRSVIRNCLSHTRDVFSSVKKLPLPQKLIEYVNLVNYNS